jgi:hypothetical protein
MNNGPTVPSSRRRVLVLLDTAVAAALSDRITALERQGAIIRVVNYRQLMAEVEALRHVVREHQIDFVLFSRNDQVYDKVSIGPLIRALRVGYSSFSGIDAAQVIAQTQVCLDDYLTRGSELALTEQTHSSRAGHGQAGTFSLIFDLEQLGGARFGLPRILNLLDQYGVTATFFTTNFIQEVYRNTIDALAHRGHEVGLHGQYHEYLSGRPLNQQSAMIRQMKCGFQPAGSISGANFIGRMDAATFDAMVANDLAYFVAFMEHRYSPFAYRKMTLHPLLVWSPHGTIWMVPISLETNNRPWFAVKNMIDSALIAGRVEGWSHISILLHPFRDGALHHIGDLDRLLAYMQDTLGYRGITVGDSVKQLPHYQPNSFIYYGLDREGDKRSHEHFWHRWWHHTPRYQQRVGYLYQTLARSGRQPALCLRPPTEAPVYAIYPHLPEEATQLQVIADDPLLLRQSGQPALFAPVGSEEPSVYAFMPSSYRNDLTTAARALRPQFRQDYAGLFPEAALRLMYRLIPDRHIF